MDVPTPWNIDNYRPIIRSPLYHSTNILSGDDTGYRSVQSHEGGEPIVELQTSNNLILRPVYAWFSIVDWSKNNWALPGSNEIMYARRAVAEWLKLAGELVAQKSDYKIIIVDGFRDFRTQASGFARLFQESLKKWWNPESIATQYDATLLADAIFSFVDVNTRLLDDAPFLESSFRQLSHDLQSDVTPEQLRKEILTAQANNALYEHLRGGKVTWKDGDYWEMKISEHGASLFQFNNNAHTGGGAVDIFLGESRMISGIQKIVPVNHVPFDHMWPESAIDFLEKESHWEKYRATAKKAWPIRNHLLALEIDPDNIPNIQFVKWRDTIRFLTHTMTSLGATYYAAENWHFNIPNLILHPSSWEIAYRWACFDIQTNTGNSCHAILIHGTKWIQTFTGEWAHNMLKK